MREAKEIVGLATHEVLMGIASWLSVSGGWLHLQVEAARQDASRQSATGESVPFVSADLDRFMLGLDVAVSRLLDLANREVGSVESSVTLRASKASKAIQD